MTKTYTPEEARAEWVKDLRSNKFTQTAGALFQDGGRCCLGVACATYERLTGDKILTRRKNEDNARLFKNGNDFEDGVLPSVVQDWLGMYTKTGEYFDERGKRQALVEDNDDRGFSFKDIANLVESNPKGLFIDAS